MISTSTLSRLAAACVALALGACSSQQMAVKSDTEATRIAREYIAAGNIPEKLKLETLTVTEMPNQWHVTVREAGDTHPGFVVIGVDKRTGRAERIVMR